MLLPERVRAIPLLLQVEEEGPETAWAARAVGRKRAVHRQPQQQLVQLPVHRTPR